MMQIDTIQVSTGHLDGVKEEITTRFRNIGEVLAQLETDLRPLESDWTGAASDSYQQRIEEWREGLADMAATLNGIGTMVSSGSSDYGETEQTIYNAWA